MRPARWRFHMPGHEFCQGFLVPQIRLSIFVPFSYKRVTQVVCQVQPGRPAADLFF